jgi:polar amino acid transport system substrate-binding protein
MRRLFALLAAALCLGGCASLGSGGDHRASADPRLDRILESGKLRVAVSADRPPLNLKSRNGEVVGFEIDLVRALATAMGLELELVVVPFADLIPSIADGRADLALSGLTMTPERNAHVAFAGPYFVSGMSVLSKQGVLTDVSDPRALDTPQRRYAAVEASTSARFIAEVLPQATFVRVADYDTGIQMVIDGKVDALFADYLACAVAVWRHPEAGLESLDTPFTIEPLGIAVAPNAPLLLNLVENYLETLDTTGLLASFKAKWLADGDWLAELP